MFVAIEGLDGVGKTALVKSLADHYAGKATNTPGPMLKPLSEPILAAFNDSPIAQCLFYAASVFAEGERARKIANGGGSVFIDRYWLSTIAYARARGISVDLSALESVVPVPDATVLLTLDESERLRRLDSRGVTKEDVETFAPEFREIVLREMQRRGRPPGMQPVAIDVTGMNQSEVMRAVTNLL